MSRKQIVTKPAGIILTCMLLLAGFVIARSTVPMTSESGSALAIQPAAQPTPPSATPRDLSQYATAGPFAIPDNMPAAARRQVVAQMRSFLWQHWQARTRARVSFVSPIRRGVAPGTTQLFVEPDGAGTWEITMEQQGGEPQRFYSVEQVRVDQDGLPVSARGRGDSTSNTTLSLHLKPTGDAESGLVF